MFDAGGRGLQHHGVRRANERAVLTIVCFNPGVSNADIARLSGLAPQTVSAILADIDRAGLITRGEVLRGRRGQPATPIFLRGEGAYSIGVEIGWRHATVLLLDLNANVLAQHIRAHDYPDAHTLLSDIAGMVDTLVTSMDPRDKDRLVDMGVSIPANFGESWEHVQAPHDQPTLWKAIDIAAELGRRTGLAVTLLNDGNAACWAELIAFPKPRPASFIYFLISHHIAAGIIGEGALWEGAAGNSANLGSMLVIDGTGRLQPAHRVASVSSLVSRLIEAGFDVDTGAVEKWDWVGFEPVVEQWIEDSARVLSRVVFNTIAVVECGTVVIDGIVPPAIVARLAQRMVVAFDQLPVASFVAPRVIAGHVGALGPAIGAAELPLYRRFFSRDRASTAG